MREESAVPGLSSPFALTRLGLLLARDPYAGLQRMYEKNGSVSGFGFGPVKYVLMLGPEANAFLFANSGLFTWREAFDVLVPVNGATSLIVSDGEDHRRRRKLVQPAFHRRRIDGYVARMAGNADEVIDTWRPGQSIDVYAVLRDLVRRSTVELLFGPRLAADADVLGRKLQYALNAIDRPYSMLVFMRSLPDPAWRRVLNARAAVVERVMREITERDNDSEPHDDVLAMLLESRDEDGGGLSDVEIQDQVISLIAAGYETTSAALAWAVHAILSTDTVWERAREEVLTVLGDGPLTAYGLQQLTYLDNVVSETLRLYPPAVMSARKVATDFTFDGQRIPKGTVVLYSPYVTHRLSAVWPEPERFRPERWDPADPDHRPATPATFLPFGGGPHRCIGAGFATTGIKVVLTQLLRRVEARTVGGPVRATSITAMRPRRGIQVEITEVRSPLPA
ncbi:MAG: cytochrome [Actinomycetia bacterium]|nr:cytochrome [Actinomycetes bacterium]